MSYRITVEAEFSAAHRLRGYRGKCENMHGHNWRVELTIEADELDDIGMVMDFAHARRMLNEVLEPLDHRLLDDLEYFQAHNPTSEQVARYVYREIKGRLSSPARVKEVSVWETAQSRATYYET